MTGKSKQNFEYLNEAYRFFREKRYAGAVVILERACEAGFETPYTLFLLALSLLHENNFSRVEAVLARLNRLDPDYLPSIQLRSFMGLKSASDRQEAVEIYLKALENCGKDRLLGRAMRKINSARNFSSLQKNARIEDFVKITRPPKKSESTPGRRDYRPGRFTELPESKGPSFSRKGAAVIIFMLLISGISLSVFLYKNQLADFFYAAHSSNTGTDNSIDMVTIGGSGYGLLNRVSRNRTPEFYSSPETLLKDFNRARKLMKRGDLNSGLIILNRIANSNSSFPVKEKCDFLIRFILDSDDRKYEKADFKKISERPYLYRGYALRVSGRAANVKELKKGMAFSLMIDYDGKNFTAVSDIFSSEKADVSNGDIVEVRGLFISSIGKKQRPYISASLIEVKSKS